MPDPSDRLDGSPALFEGRLAEWAAWQGSPWGRLRYRVVAHTLARTCDELALARGGRPLRVLDVGGGDGADAVPLAVLGHHVSVLDNAQAMLALAARRAAAADTSVELLQADLADLPELGLPGFDLVLCHFVIQYLDDPQAGLGVAAAMVRPGGAISVIAPNPASDVLVTAVRGLDPLAALALLDADMVHGATFDHAVRRVEAQPVAAALAGLGFGPVTRYGIRCVMDLIADQDRKHDPVFAAALERLELALCDREPFMSMARMWQLIARQP